MAQRKVKKILLRRGVHCEHHILFHSWSPWVLLCVVGVCESFVSFIFEVQNAYPLSPSLPIDGMERSVFVVTECTFVRWCPPLFKLLRFITVFLKLIASKDALHVLLHQLQLHTNDGVSCSTILCLLTHQDCLVDAPASTHVPSALQEIGVDVDTSACVV